MVDHLDHGRSAAWTMAVARPDRRRAVRRPPGEVPVASRLPGGGGQEQRGILGKKTMIATP
jgi:hypothetical protein